MGRFSSSSSAVSAPTHGTAATRKQGDRGERQYGLTLRQFCKTVSELHSTDIAYEIRHGLSIPVGKDGKQFDGDVDFVAASGNRLVLIDVKLWKPGIYFSIPLTRRNRPGSRVAFRGVRRHVDNKAWMSQNMLIALERYQERLGKHGVKVTAMVVFIRSGSTGVHFTRSLVWPGGIRTFDDAESFTELYHRLGAPESANSQTVSLINKLTRKVTS